MVKQERKNRKNEVSKERLRQGQNQKLFFRGEGLNYYFESPFKVKIKVLREHHIFLNRFEYTKIF